MNTYLITTGGTARLEIQGKRFYLQDGFFWFVDDADNCVFAKDAKDIISIELTK
jgi:hypothetical protein